MERWNRFKDFFGIIYGLVAEDVESIGLGEAVIHSVKGEIEGGGL